MANEANAAGIELIIEPKSRDLGEFSVRRSLPDRRRQRIGPFIFFDHMGPAEFPPGRGVNVRSHPHIGLATITYLFEGEILHRDSLGYVQPIQPGAVNWMTAGRGIVHSEKVTEDVLATGQQVHGIQTWIALPTEAEEIEPRFEHYPADDIPRKSIDGAELTLIVGVGFGLESPVRTESETLYAEAVLEAGACISLPDAEELGIYVVEGSMRFNGQSIEAGRMLVLEGGARGTVEAATACRLMLCGGARLAGDRHIWWNFVSSSKQRLEKAKDDWRDGSFDKVPDETDFIPLPEM